MYVSVELKIQVVVLNVVRFIANLMDKNRFLGAQSFLIWILGRIVFS